MHIAFSTLGCPSWSWNDIVATATDMKIQGIEIRGIGNEMYAPKTAPLKNGALKKTLEDMKRVGLVFSMMSAGCEIADKENNNAVMGEMFDYIDLAQKCGCKYVRVMAESTPHMSRDVDLDYTLGVYKDILDYAKDKNVFPLMETNGIFASSKVMSNFIESTNRDNAGVLWDIHHPFRFFGEDVEATYDNLRGMIKYVHIKDSVMKDSKVEYRMLGYGDVPLVDAIGCLQNDGYDGFLSLEWLKRWTPDLEDPGIVFSHYVFYMRYLLEQ